MAEFLDQVISRFNGEVAVIQLRPQARFETPVAEEIESQPIEEPGDTFEPHDIEVPGSSTPVESVSGDSAESRESSAFIEPAINKPVKSIDVKERREVNNIEHRRIVVERVVEERSHDAKKSIPVKQSKLATEPKEQGNSILSSEAGNENHDASYSEINRRPTEIDDYSNHEQVGNNNVMNKGHGEWLQPQEQQMLMDDENHQSARDTTGQQFSNDATETPLYPVEQLDKSFSELGVAEANDTNTHQERIVTINIGRIEIGEAKPRPEPVKAQIVSRTKPAKSLEQYLRARAGDSS